MSRYKEFDKEYFANLAKDPNYDPLLWCAIEELEIRIAALEGGGTKKLENLADITKPHDGKALTYHEKNSRGSQI